MPLPKKIVIVAGEESGDKHAAELVQQLLATNQPYDIAAIGGKHLKQTGVHLINDLAQYGVTGLSDVFQHFFIIKKAFSQIKAFLHEKKPDLLILVDYPGFNLRLAKYAKQKLGIRILYYISPQIWAWKAKRIVTIKENIDHMAVILPFEKHIYQQANVAASFVGHPLTKRIPEFNDLSELRQQLNLPIDKKIIAILPGSRRNEIKWHMPILVETIHRLNQKYSDLHFVIPVAGTLDCTQLKAYFSFQPSNLTWLNGQALEAAASSDCVVVASGTASLECALLKKPMCIIYKSSLLNYHIAMKVIRVKYLGLCNLLTNKMLAPELLQYDFNVHELTKMVEMLLYDDEFKARMIAQLKQLKWSLSLEQADDTLLSLVQKVLNP